MFKTRSAARVDCATRRAGGRRKDGRAIEGKKAGALVKFKDALWSSVVLCNAMSDAMIV
jgi:hypothetical protein